MGLRSVAVAGRARGQWFRSWAAAGSPPDWPVLVAAPRPARGPLPTPPAGSTELARLEWPSRRPVWKSKFYGVFVLNCRVNLHAIDVTPDRWRGDAGSSPLDRVRTAASSDALVDSTQTTTLSFCASAHSPTSFDRDQTLKASSAALALSRSDTVESRPTALKEAR